MSKCPIRSLASLSLLVREVKRKKPTAFLLQFLSSYCHHYYQVQYLSSTLTEIKKERNLQEVCNYAQNPSKKNLGGSNVRETEDIASSKQNFWTQAYDIAQGEKIKRNQQKFKNQVTAKQTKKKPQNPVLLKMRILAVDVIFSSNILSQLRHQNH